MSSDLEFSNLLLSLYSVPTEPSKWPAVLAQVTTYLGLDAAALFSIDSSNDRASIGVTVETSPEATSLYARYFWKKDLWRAAAEQRAEMSPLFGPQICSVTDLKKTEFYSDFLRKHHEFSCYFGLVTHRTDRITESVTFAHSLKSEVPGQESLNRLKLVLPHLRSALLLRRKFVELEYAKTDRESALHTLRWGIILVDVRGTCFFLNRAADVIVAQSDGLVLRGGQLTATLPHESSQLSALINRVRIFASKPAPLSVIQISRENRKPLQLFVSPFVPANLELPRKPVALVVIMDPELQSTPPADVLRALYGLTPAEARLAVALAQGVELRRVCDEFSITYTTGRAHLRNIFSKTGVSRQTELVRLVLGNGLALAINLERPD